MPTTPNMIDYLSPRLWTGVVRELPFPTVHIGDKYFPSRDVASDRLEWDYIYNESPIAPFVAPGAESPQIETDEMLSKGWAEVAYIRYKASLRENDVRWLRAFGSVPPNQIGGNMAAAARDNISRLATKLNASVDNRKEWMRISSLLGSMVVSPTSPENAGKSEIAFTITLPVRTATAGTGDSPALWDDLADADPYGDIRLWFNELPYTPTEMIISKHVLWTLARNARLRGYLLPFSNLQSTMTPGFLTRQQLIQFFNLELGLNVTVYDSEFTYRVYDSSGRFTLTRVRYMPANRVIFVPDGPVGYTASAPAPQNDWNSGKFTWTSTPEESGRKDPWVTEFGVGEYCMPIMEQPDRVLVATVTA